MSAERERGTMGRGIFPHEIADPDYQWLIKNYCETSAPVAVVDSGCLPVVMILLEEGSRPLMNRDMVSPALLGGIGDSSEDDAGREEPKKG